MPAFTCHVCGGPHSSGIHTKHKRVAERIFHEVLGAPEAHAKEAGYETEAGAVSDILKFVLTNGIAKILEEEYDSV